MIDEFSIFNKGGAVLWSRKVNPTRGRPIDHLVQTVLLEEKQGESSYKIDPYTLKWTFANEIDLIFVAVYLNITQLFYIDELLELVKREFCALFKAEILRCEGHSINFDERYDKILSKFERRQIEEKEAKRPRKFEETKKGQTVCTREGTDSGAADSDTGKRKKGGNKRRAKSGAKNASKSQKESSDDDNSSEGSSDKKEEEEPKKFVGELDEQERQAALARLKEKGLGVRGKRGPAKPNAPAKKPPKEQPEEPQKPKKELRKWGDAKLSEAEKKALDRSNSSETPDDQKFADEDRVEIQEATNIEDDEPLESDSESEDGEKEEKAGGSVKSGLWNMFRTLTGTKPLTKEDLQPVLDNIRDTLTSKNVALDIAVKLCDSVRASMEGKQLGAFSTLRSAARKAMEEALNRLLTPKRPVDILRGIQAAKRQGRSYTIVFVGVNGVGKSTSLSKVCYWLLARKFKVSMVACDTFRSGAVEQLRTHSCRLGVPLFERGYNKDPAAVAMEGIKQGILSGSDVVLIDTAGRMQDNEPLMRALAKLITTNKPDLVLFVGEALVGNDAVDQLTKFNRCLADLSTEQHPRLIDGIVLTKFDTIDDKVGAAISMTYSTGQPIVFVGTGQNYSDLKKMNTKMLIRALLK